MPSVRPHKDKWRAFVEVEGARESKVFRTQREAKAWAAVRDAELRRPAEARYTLRDVLNRYEAEVTVHKRGARAESLRIAAFLRDWPHLADKAMAVLDAPDLAAWRDGRLLEVSSGSVLRDLNWLRAALRIARDEWRWTDRDPLRGMRRPADNPARTRRVSPAEVRRMCRHLGYVTGNIPQTKQQEVALIFLVALRTAMRAGEILSLGCATLDLHRRVATVMQHKTAHITGKPRIIPLTSAAVRLLRVVAGRERCFEITSASLDALFRKARDQLMLTDLHFHDSRAEAITRLARKIDVLTLSRISGHKDLRMLSDHYYRETAEDIAIRLGASSLR